MVEKEHLTLEEWDERIKSKNPYTYKDLNLKVRNCCECGSKMYWATFMIGYHNKVQREHFTYDMLCEIWANTIFVIRCCECFHHHIPFANYQY